MLSQKVLNSSAVEQFPISLFTNTSKACSNQIYGKAMSKRLQVLLYTSLRTFWNRVLFPNGPWTRARYLNTTLGLPSSQAMCKVENNSLIMKVYQLLSVICVILFGFLLADKAHSNL
jgi:hypothetical protein